MVPARCNYVILSNVEYGVLWNYLAENLVTARPLWQLVECVHLLSIEASPGCTLTSRSQVWELCSAAHCVFSPVRLQCFVHNKRSQETDSVSVWVLCHCSQNKSQILTYHIWHFPSLAHPVTTGRTGLRSRRHLCVFLSVPARVSPFCCTGGHQR